MNNTVNIRVLEASWKRFKTRATNARRTLMEEIDLSSKRKLVDIGSLVIRRCGDTKAGYVCYEYGVVGVYPKFGKTPEEALKNYQNK